MNRLKMSISIFLMLVVVSIHAQEKPKIIIDADTGNEVDDPFAIALILMDTSIEVLSLNATHWQTSHWAEDNTMENSHRVNQQLLGEMGLNVKTRRGGHARMYDWGDRAQHSAAAYEIIDQVRQLGAGEKLNIIALGALTNVASAVLIDPSIASRIELFWLGTTYDFERNILGRDDFNCMMDQYALTYLLRSEVAMNVIPINVASDMIFSFEEIKEHISGGSLGNFLINRWYDHLDGSRKERTIWDLSIVSLFLHPEWGESIEITTTRDNGSKNVNYFKSIDADAIRTDFYEKMRAFDKK